MAGPLDAVIVPDATFTSRACTLAFTFVDVTSAAVAVPLAPPRTIAFAVPFVCVESNANEPDVPIFAVIVPDTG